MTPPSSWFQWIGFTFLLTTLGIFATATIGIYGVIIFVSLPILLLLLFNFRWAFSLLIISLFVFTYVLRLSSSVIIVPYILLSFLISVKPNFNFLKSPLNISLSIFLSFLIPSYFFAENLKTSLYLSINIFAFLIIYFISVIHMNEKNSIRSFIKIFLFMSICNGIFILIQAFFTRGRLFGFTGIFYVDLVGISILLILIKIFFEKKVKLFIYLPFLLILISALFLTQTRNSVLTISLSGFVLFFLVYKLADVLKISKNIILVWFVLIFLVTVILLYFITTLESSSFSRLGQLSNFNYTFDNEGNVQNTLITRILIWDTAIAIIKENFWFGIGIYGFPFASESYYTIPRFLFEAYVKGLTPHQSYLAILTETGIFGFSGFLILILSSLIISMKTIKLIKDENSAIIFLLLFIPLVYIIFSMLLTDAWLWGQGLLVWGIILGANVSFRTSLNSSAELCPSS